ncbi:glycoside hydrolase family 19 protein [Pseudomonas moorei]|uniref:glycoside hydrolase family 19 protein n=1 Tax=Pseudomonas moorei TaxID=395599 RepID=UPI00200D4B81|nr:glycoside hydrolase family 19 protein [Pseudomonas moorei]
MLVSEKQLLQILPASGARVSVFAPLLDVAMGRYQITTKSRIAAFIAQVGHESGQLRYLRELGNEAYLSKYDTGPLAARLGNTPHADGDGQKYRGRGLIQITGLRNYQRCGDALELDLINHPEWLEQPELACLSAAWFWHSTGLNGLADDQAFESITRRINGGLSGQANRLALYRVAMQVLK